MSPVKELFLQTQALFEYVSQSFPKEADERDRFIATIDEQLQYREQHLAKIDAMNLSELEKKLGEELVKLNKRLNKRLEEVRAEIRANITEVQKKKENARKYESPYEGTQTDGIFFDSRGV
ncbi:flagellar protein [Halalkalibacter krulwichiae]|uniref:Flagellar protein FliT n=1 Tax=Halalkalibacter krulwichiae TaxID=199441 RepID=A0A1X9MF57_9BACI|nr:flagellar protein [Halalkalibacter krulwichiae]ARK32077.1 hypothetical protein BkAM31D_20775 [Halalkalibacter krulwichiae]